MIKIQLSKYQFTMPIENNDDLYYIYILYLVY